MGKRSDYPLRPRDAYFTPEKAVWPLLPHLGREFTFAEPCAGDGRLVDHLEKLFEATCLLALDIEPQQDYILQADSSNLTSEAVENCKFIITNPPYTWSVLQPMLNCWPRLTDTILLLPADFMHNARMKPYMDMCYRVVSVGRVKWIEDSKTAGVDNYAWYFFREGAQRTIFYGKS